ncbi:MAG: hypothetical protein M1836_005463 [Candelina mexicana]|nr:MAG: hypothetical protein M1836_005463 [Candelina mexicana]
MTKQMSILLRENIVDEGLRDWIIPDFSTTNENGRITSSIIMMATLKAYFNYQFMLLCGIPRVTLLGEKADWKKLVSKIDRLKKYGPETTQWSELLRPVLVRFASSFDSPNSDATKAFWQRIAHEKGGGSGPDKLSG